MGGAEGEHKEAVVFPAGSSLGHSKMLTLHRRGPFEITVKYVDDAPVVPGTASALGKYRIELPASAEIKQVKVKTQLCLSGIFRVESAHVVEEEEYEETVKEKHELPTDQHPAEVKEEDPEKKYEWIDVVKKRKRTKRTELVISTSGTPGLSHGDLEKLTNEETAMQSEMREIIETDERKNDLESYVLSTRDKISTTGVWGAYICDEEREKFTDDLRKAEDWLYDHFDAAKIEFMDKLDELMTTGDPVAWRANEGDMRDQWIQAVVGTVENYRTAAEKPGDKYGHIAPEKLSSIVGHCKELSEWIDDMKAKQDNLPKHERPVLLCKDMETKNKELAKFADDIFREPKPAPPKDEKAEEGKAEEKKEETN